MSALSLAESASADEISLARAVIRDEHKVVKDSVAEVYRLIETNLGSLGGIESAAAICNTDRSDLRRAIEHKARKNAKGEEVHDRYLSIDHVVALGARMRKFNASVATELGFALCRPMELIVFPLVEMRPEDENRLWRSFMQRNCPALLSMFDKEIGR